MIGTRAWRLAAAVLAVAISMGAAPAPSSYVSVESAAATLRQSVEQGAAGADWLPWIDGLIADLAAYSQAPSENERLRVLGRLYEKRNELRGQASPPVQQLGDVLGAWLGPRIQLSWATRQLGDQIRALPAEPSSQSMLALDQELAAAVASFEKADTVAKRIAARAQFATISATLNQAPWGQSSGVQKALADLYSQPNIEAVADFQSAASFLSRPIVEKDVIFREGQYSYITPGPYLGFDLLSSDDGIAFRNRQIAYSYTPIRDFQQQLEKDPRGRLLARLYRFTAETRATTPTNATTIFSTSGVRILIDSQPDVQFLLGISPQPCSAHARIPASLIGFDQERFREEVYKNALPEVKAGAIRGNREETAERSAEAQNQLNATLRPYLIGNNSVLYRNLAVTGVSLRTRPDHIAASGVIRSGSGDLAQGLVGADMPLPPALWQPSPGISTDLHVPSILTNLADAYFQSPQLQGVENLMVETRGLSEGSPIGDSITTTRNVSDETYEQAAARVREANNPEVIALRIKRPSRPPQFGTDLNGNLVALVNDLQLDIAAPKPMQNAPRAIQNLETEFRIVTPQAEFSLELEVLPAVGYEPTRVRIKVLDFEPGFDAQILTKGPDGTLVPVSRLRAAAYLAAIPTRIEGREFTVPLEQLRLPSNLALQSVSKLDPSGWARLVLSTR